MDEITQHSNIHPLDLQTARDYFNVCSNWCSNWPNNRFNWPWSEPKQSQSFLLQSKYYSGNPMHLHLSMFPHHLGILCVTWFIMKPNISYHHPPDKSSISDMAPDLRIIKYNGCCWPEIWWLYYQDTIKILTLSFHSCLPQPCPRANWINLVNQIFLKTTQPNILKPNK